MQKKETWPHLIQTHIQNPLKMDYNCKLLGEYRGKSLWHFFGHDPNGTSSKAQIDNGIVSKYSEETICDVEENIHKPYI